jgi:hypothetical protein
VYGSHIPGSTHNIFKAAAPTNDIFIIASGHKYDSIKDFDSLRVAIRQIEMKHTLEQQLYEKEKKSKPNPAKAAHIFIIALFGTI